MLVRIIDATAEGRTKVVRIASGVGDEVVAPSIEHASVGIGEAIGHISLKAMGARLEAVDRTIVVAQRAVARLYLSAVEHAVAQVNRATRVQADGVGRVVRIGRIHTHEDALLGVGLAVIVGIANPPEIRGLHEQDSVLIELKASGAVQVVHEHRFLIGLAVAVGVLVDEQLIPHLAGRCALRVVGPHSDPETTAGIPSHLDRVHQIGETFLVGKEIHLHAGVDRHLADGFLAIDIDLALVGVGSGFVGLHRRHGRQV